MISLSVVIPAFNEENGIATVLERIRALPIDAEIIVVDDGSTDETAVRARAVGVKVISHPANGGYGLSLKSGIRAASHDLIAITDADGTYAVEDLPALASKLEEGFDMAVGARHGAAYWGLFLKMPARFVFKFLVEFSTGKHIPDINSGLRVFRKSDVEPLFPLLCDTFSFTTSLTLAYCFLHKFICYLPTSYEKRIGHSKVRIIRDSLRTLQFLVESIAYFNPLKLFLLLSFPLFLVALGLWGTGWFMQNIWISLAGIPFFLGSILLFALGVLANMLRLQR